MIHFEGHKSFPLPVTTVAAKLSDAAFLAAALPKLPGHQDDHAPVTLDLGPSVAVRARGEGQERTASVVLPKSRTVGPRVCVVTDRQYLRRAVQLGFAEIQVTTADRPLVCRDDTRTYVWMPLPNEPAPKAEDAQAVPASSTTNGTSFRGSYLSMIAACRAIRWSILSVVCRISA